MHEKEAVGFVEVIKTLAENPEKLEDLKHYLTHHFPGWLERHAKTPENLVSELRWFAGLDSCFGYIK